VESLVVWALANSEWLGFYGTALFGGLVGHALAFETSIVKWSRSKHVVTMLTGWLYSLFIGHCVYLIWQAMGWNIQIMYLSAGIFSVFGSRTILWAYNKAMSRLDGATNNGS
jgi:hypothetical protein